MKYPQGLFLITLGEIIPPNEQYRWYAISATLSKACGISQTADVLENAKMKCTRLGQFTLAYFFLSQRAARVLFFFLPNVGKMNDVERISRKKDACRTCPHMFSIRYNAIHCRCMCYNNIIDHNMHRFTNKQFFFVIWQKI